jgi:hypothetical protein
MITGNMRELICNAYTDPTVAMMPAPVLRACATGISGTTWRTEDSGRG